MADGGYARITSRVGSVEIAVEVTAGVRCERAVVDDGAARDARVRARMDTGARRQVVRAMGARQERLSSASSRRKSDASSKFL
ncbi:MAG: hypothetical protein ACKOQ7_05800 [Actinomycetota bacterium]